MKLIGLLTAMLMIYFGIATAIPTSSTSSDLITCRKTDPEAPPETGK